VGSESLYIILADTVLILHVLVVLFVVVGLVAIYTGKALAWSWIRNPWFRIFHVMATTVVAIQSWFGVLCPLTTLEMSLRNQAGGATYSSSFIEYWLGALLYYQAPSWVFMLAYSLFGILVLASWFFVRPRPFASSKKIGR